jgi:hypothetical protein
MTRVITQAPPRPANDSRWRLRGFAITCRFRNGAALTLTAIAPNSSMAICNCERMFEGYTTGYTVRSL